MQSVEHHCDFVVVGGGLPGICAAVTAARQGVKTALVQDRPVLGGNASTEIRVPPVGASHCNFAYSRETGLVEELFLNNLYRNPTWCPEGWSLELENLVRNESSLDLFLNCAVCEIGIRDVSSEARSGAKAKKDAGSGNQIDNVKAYCAMAETWHVFHAPVFADCSGDGVVGALAGAAFRMGVEARSEFNEPMCPEEATSNTMGMSLHLHARDAGRPMPFTRPAWVDMELNADDFGPYRPVCDHFFPDTGGFWWLEWGGALDAVHDTMKIKDEVQRITLAVWDYLKNRSPLAEKLTNYELDWMGAVPGKRESRRFEGDHILTMGDIDGQVHFADAVAYGGWGFDHHPPGGFYDKVNPSTHEYLRGPHNVPLRSLYSRNISNLFFAGRNISASHYALSSTRVMLTCAQLGEAVGMAAAHAVRLGCTPRELVEGDAIRCLQKDLIRTDHHIHGLSESSVGQAFLPVPPERDALTRVDRQECLSYREVDIAPEATVTASSTLADRHEVPSWGTEPLVAPRMQLLPIQTDRIESISLRLNAREDTQLSYRFFQGPANGSTYPDQEVATGKVDLTAGADQWVALPIACDIARPGWHFLLMEANPLVRLHLVESAPGRLLYHPRHVDPIRPNPFSNWTVRSLNIIKRKAADAAGQPATEWNEQALGARDFSRFLGFSYRCRVLPEQPVYEPAMVVNPHSRPTNLPNLWVSAPTDFSAPECLELTWDSPRDITGIQVLFDSSLHFHFGQSWQGYAVKAISSLVKDYRLVATLNDDSEAIVAEVENNYQRNRNHAAELHGVTGLRLECLSTNGIDRTQVYAIRVYELPGAGFSH